jgi:hypothetical protein
VISPSVVFTHPFGSFSGIGQLAVHQVLHLVC